MKLKKMNLIFDCLVGLLVLFFSGFLCLWGPHSVQAGINEWSRVGPEGGTVQALAVDPSDSKIICAGMPAAFSGALTGARTGLRSTSA